jgi:hypothetical protein
MGQMKVLLVRQGSSLSNELSIFVIFFHCLVIIQSKLNFKYSTRIKLMDCDFFPGCNLQQLYLHPRPGKEFGKFLNPSYLIPKLFFNSSQSLISHLFA